MATKKICFIQTVLGLAILRPISSWQPDRICRFCGGQDAEGEVTTKKLLPEGYSVAFPCHWNKECYQGTVNAINRQLSK